MEYFSKIREKKLDQTQLWQRSIQKGRIKEFTDTRASTASVPNLDKRRLTVRGKVNIIVFGIFAKIKCENKWTRPISTTINTEHLPEIGSVRDCFEKKLF